MNNGDTAWILASSALVLLMTPGLAFFYGGLVRRKNATATIMHSFMAIGLVGVVWVLWGYSLAFGPDVAGLGLIGDLSWFGLAGVSATEAGPYASNIPHQAFMIFQSAQLTQPSTAVAGSVDSPDPVGDGGVHDGYPQHYEN